MSEYKVTVVFTRSHDDDDELIRDKYPDAPFAEGATKQLRDELQLCCDDLGLPAGSFEIVKVEEAEPRVLSDEEWMERLYEEERANG